MNKNELLEEFEFIESHLDGKNTSPDQIMLNGERLSKGQFGHSLYPCLFPSSLVMLFPRWNLDKIKHFYEKDYFESYRLDSKPDVGVLGIKKMHKKSSIDLKIISHPLMNIRDYLT